jgi:2,3-bisphosphoglycerate-dependent phosphoglycerate mutase
MPFGRTRKSIFMKTFLAAAIIAFLFISCTRTVYIVRHAEKAVPTDTLGKPVMDNDPPLSEAGKVRAIVLKDQLSGKHIRHIYSTNFIRTFYTADPLSKSTGLPIQTYRNVDSLVALIRSVKGNVLVVGHSNTIDDIVNKLTGENKLTDLKDYEYDNLFVVKLKGKKAFFERKKYGYPSNP